MSVLDDLLFSWLCSVTAVSNLQDSLSLSLSTIWTLQTYLKLP